MKYTYKIIYSAEKLKSFHYFLPYIRVLDNFLKIKLSFFSSVVKDFLYDNDTGNVDVQSVKQLHQGKVLLNPS